MANQNHGLRERTRRAVQQDIVTIAIDLFLTQGFDATTIDQIATAAGLSYRSFFRYFAGKDDLLVQALASTGDDIAAALTARPADEPAWTALRRAFDPLLAQTGRDEQARTMTRLMMNSPTVQAGHQNKDATWRATIAAALAPRLHPRDTAARNLAASALTGSALACLHSAQTAWVDSNSRRSLDELVDAAMVAVHPFEAGSE